MSQLWSQLEFFRPGWRDFLQILIVALLLFRLLLIIQRTRAMQILLGVLLIAAAYLLSQVLELTLIETLLGYLLQYGVIAGLVVFQPELRTALTRLGQSRLLRIVSPMPEGQLIDEIVHGVEELAQRKLGPSLFWSRTWASMNTHTPVAENGWMFRLPCSRRFLAPGRPCTMVL